jgi:hypothetical protein
VPGACAPAATISLGPPLPAASCGLPAGSGGQPSNACAAPVTVSGQPSPYDLAPGGVYRAARVTSGAGGLLHHRFTLTAQYHAAVCSLWHYPAGHPGWALPTTVPCGARTFLDDAVPSTAAAARPARPPFSYSSLPRRPRVLTPAYGGEQPSIRVR